MTSQRLFFFSNRVTIIVNVFFFLCLPINKKLKQRAGSNASLGSRFLQIPDLFDQVGLLVVELLVVRAVLLEVAQEVDEFGLVLEQDVDDGLSLVGVCYKHLGETKKGQNRRKIQFSFVLFIQRRLTTPVTSMCFLL